MIGSTVGSANYIVAITAEQVGLWQIQLSPANVNNVANAAFGIAGAVAVICIIIGGLLYSTAAGDPGKIQRGKNTIIYAAVGLIVVTIAFPVISYVIGSV